MDFSRASSQNELILEEAEDVLFLAVEEDGEHPYIHFPHCKTYLVLSLGWILLITLSVPVAIGYARPALILYNFEASQCKVDISKIRAYDDSDYEINCLSKNNKLDYDCLVTRAVEKAKCGFGVIPLCFQKPCRCIQVKADVVTNGTKIKSLMLYDFEDTYLNYPMCSVSPCSDESVFEDLFTKIKVGDHNLKCFANKNAAIYHLSKTDSKVTVFGSLVLPLLLLVVWLCVSIYVLKRTWRVTRQDFKSAVEFRFNAWPPRPAHFVRASLPSLATMRSNIYTQ